MIELRWLSAGVIFGLLVSTILIPPTRKQVRIPQPNDPRVYHTETGGVRFTSVEVPCVQEADSLNVLASLTKK